MRKNQIGCSMYFCTVSAEISSYSRDNTGKSRKPGGDNMRKGTAHLLNSCFWHHYPQILKQNFYVP